MSTERDPSPAAAPAAPWFPRIGDQVGFPPLFGHSTGTVVGFGPREFVLVQLDGTDWTERLPRCAMRRIGPPPHCFAYQKARQQGETWRQRQTDQPPPR
jgi:hypothetical protein